MTDGETRIDNTEPPRGDSALRDAFRTLPERVPGMAPNAPKRNVLVALGTLLGSGLLISVTTAAL